MGRSSVKIRLSRRARYGVSVPDAAASLLTPLSVRSSTAPTTDAERSSIDGTATGSQRTLRWRSGLPTRKRIAKLNRKERAANKAARVALSREMQRNVVAVLDDFRLRGLNRTAFGQAFSTGASVVIADNAALGFGVLEARMGAVISGAVEQAVARGASIGANFSKIPGLAIDQNLVREGALSYLNNPRQKQVLGNIAARSRAGVKQAIGDMIQGGLSPGQAQIQIAENVGLTSRQTKQVGNFRRRITAQRLPPGARSTGRIRALIQRDVTNFSNRLASNRARQIATNEMQRALQQGEKVFWRQAASQGDVDLEQVTKTWFTVDDDDVCEICEPLHGLTVPFNADFAGEFDTPPAHIECRCYVEYTPVESR